MGKLALVLLDFGTVINHFRIHVASSGLIDGLVIAGISISNNNARHTVNSRYNHVGYNEVFLGTHVAILILITSVITKYTRGP